MTNRHNYEEVKGKKSCLCSENVEILFENKINYSFCNQSYKQFTE